MIIGCTKELKNHEYRVGLTPDNVTAYVSNGHKVYVETGAGVGAGFNDQDYFSAGAVILATAKEVFDIAEMIVKVKEPEECEWQYFKAGQILFTFLHLAANKALADMLIEKQVTAIAYETITDKKGRLPCLKPMSEIAGRLSIQEGAKYLEKEYGGRGILLGGIEGVPAAKVVVIGAGTAGTEAIDVAVSLKADVIALDINVERLNYLDYLFYAHTRIRVLKTTKANITKALKIADLVICAVLIPGEKTPKLIRREHLKMMKPGAVIVDIAIDQGGCCETSHVTSHDKPTFIEEGIVHYCVGNMPGAVPQTSTIALTNATIKYGLSIANKGLEKAIKLDEGLKNGVNLYKGKCVNEHVSKTLGYELSSL